jgi:hypothetical protein
MTVVDRKAYQKLRLSELNLYDIDRTMREDIYGLEQEDIRVEALINEMVKENIPLSIILGWMRQLEDNAGEIVYLNTLMELDLKGYDFSGSTVFKRGPK